MMRKPDEAAPEDALLAKLAALAQGYAQPGLGARGDEVGALQKKLRAVGLHVPEHELKQQVFGAGTRDAVAQFQARRKLAVSGEPNEQTLAALENTGESAARIEGQLRLARGAEADRVTLRAYRKGFGGTAERVGEATTDARGYYSLPYGAVSHGANVEVRAVDANGEEVTLSTLRLDAGQYKLAALVAPDAVKPPAAEYQRLRADVTAALGDADRLAHAQEKGDRQDLTILRVQTGWDARLLALGALAARTSETVGMSPEALYALYRAGFASAVGAFAKVGGEAVEDVLTRSSSAGVIALDADAIAAERKRYEAFAHAQRLQEKAPGAPSSLGELLSIAPLDARQRQTFEALLAQPRQSDAELWARAAEAELPVEHLKHQSRLASLTLNSVPVMTSLAGFVGAPDRMHVLAEKGFHRPETWTRHLRSVARDDEELAKAIPPAYLGEGLDARLDAYAEDLARKVRLAFPTHTLQWDIANDAVRLGEGHAVEKRRVGDFLAKAIPLGYRVGEQSVEGFVRRNEAALFEGVPDAQRRETVESVKTLQRVSQMATDHAAVQTLYALGFHSAQKVVALSEDDFVARYGRHFVREDTARLIHQKAEQTSAMVYNAFLGAVHASAGPSLAATSPPVGVRETIHQNLVSRYPTLERLFGSLDFCECQHCRSVLGPAAYFVDLLHFLDPDDDVWRTHPANRPLDHKRKPFDALVARRPDLPELPLTCANTSTALPYIDLVNEILEHAVARPTLVGAARDTGDAKTADLLAEPPQIVAAAYDTLKRTVYPMNLPFDLWTETARRLLGRFDVPLWRLRELFPQGDGVALARVGVSAAEMDAVFAPTTLHADWQALYGPTGPTTADDLTEVRGLTRNARDLSRRLGLSYQELVDVFQTGFLNPSLGRLIDLQRAGVDHEDALRYKGVGGRASLSPTERTAFEASFALAWRAARAVNVTAPAELAALDAKVAAAWARFQAMAARELGRVLLFTPHGGECDFSKTWIQYADGGDPTDLDLLKLNLFVRLWRKLGWTIAETDLALRAFAPAITSAAEVGPAFRTTLLRAAHARALEEALELAPRDRVKLLTLWTDLPTHGSESLYVQWFLRPGIPTYDPSFDDPIGGYLPPPTAGDTERRVGAHLSALQAGLGLTASDLEAVLARRGTSPAQCPLTLATVSMLHRHGFLARALKLSVPELLTLTELTGFDPFIDPASPPVDANDPFALPATPTPLAAPEDDVMATRTLPFVRAVKSLRGGGFTVADAAELCRHDFGAAGEPRSSGEARLALARRAAAEIDGVRKEYSSLPENFTEDKLRAGLGLIYPAEVAGVLAALLADTLELKASCDVSDVAAREPIDPRGLDDDRLRSPVHNAVRQTQTLVIRGVLRGHAPSASTDAYAARMRAIRVQATTTPQERADIDRSIARQVATLNALFANASAQAKDLFRAHLWKQTPHDAHGFVYAPGGLDAAFDGLFPAVDTESARAARRSTLAGSFFPWLQERLVNSALTQVLSAHAGLDASLTDALLRVDGALPAALPASLEALKAVEVRGVSARWYETDAPPASDLGSPTLAPDVRVDASTRPAGVTVRSARFDAFVEAPAAGSWRLFATLPAGASVEVRLDDRPDPEPVATAREYVVELRAGVLHRLRVEFRGLSGGDASLDVLGQTMSRGPLARFVLRPAAEIGRFLRAVSRVEKVARVVQKFSLSAREVRHFAARGADFGYDEAPSVRRPFAWTNLPGDGTEALPAPRAFRPLVRLFDYVGLRDELAGGADDLLRVFELARRPVAPGVTDAVAVESVHAALDVALGAVTRQKPEVIRDACVALGLHALTVVDGVARTVTAAGFTHERALRRIWDALQMAGALGVKVSAMTAWATTAPTGETARAMKDTLRAGHAVEVWRELARPVFDDLRRLQRDALVAYVRHQKRLETLESLYEHFLLDPGMEPVVQTSRLRLAISSVQLFVQRCLLNLEDDVLPSAIDASQWEWMKRYRVWEANRKIFLYPENWLEPEFRDDKTHLFQALEGQLLQGDLSQESAEDAFFAYLKGLEVIARLDIVTTFFEEHRESAGASVLHVVGRTFSAPYRYFYRRLKKSEWTPWEPVDVDIEGDHVVAAVWRDRPHLFWVTFLDKAEEESAGSDAHSLLALGKAQVTRKPRHTIEARLNWTERFQGRWVTRAGGGLSEPIVVKGLETFDPATVFIHVTLADNAVTVHLNGAAFGGQASAFRVLNKNVAPEVVATLQPPDNPYSTDQTRAGRHLGSGEFQVMLNDRIVTRDGLSMSPTTGGANQPRTILAKALRAEGRYTLTPCAAPVVLRTVDPEAPFKQDLGPWVAPFFYADAAHTFYVEPTLTESVSLGSEDVPVYGGPPGVRVPPRYTVPVTPWYPKPGPFPDPIDPGDPYVLPELGMQEVINPRITVELDGKFFDAEGVLGVEEAGTLRVTRALAPPRSGIVAVGESGARTLPVAFGGVQTRRVGVSNG